MILKVGLTGGIASGKSTVGRYLAGLGATVIDADSVVHELYRPGQPGYLALVDRYGDEILTPGGEIDRAKLSRLALSTPVGAEELNRLIHPLVIREESRRLEAMEAEGDDRIVVVEATLLLESGGRDRYDCIVVVDTDPEIQIARAVHRGMPEREARVRLSRQMNREERLAAADVVIDSSGPVEQTLEQTDELWKRLTSWISDRDK